MIGNPTLISYIFYIYYTFENAYISVRFPSFFSYLNSLILLPRDRWNLVMVSTTPTPVQDHVNNIRGSLEFWLELLITSDWSSWLQECCRHISVQLYLGLTPCLAQQPQPRQQWRLLSDHRPKDKGQCVLQRDKCLSHFLCSGRGRHDCLCWWVASKHICTINQLFQLLQQKQTINRQNIHTFVADCIPKTMLK